MYTDADMDLNLENLHRKWDKEDRHAFVERMIGKMNGKMRNREHHW